MDWFDSSVVWSQTKHKPWPYVTLERFNTISPRLDKLKEYDYVFYFDSDLECIDYINEFDIQSNKNYFAVCHPVNLKRSDFWPVETNESSTACLKERLDRTYVQGCLWGARGSHIEHMVNTMKNNIQSDLQNDIIAVWHDESHLNKFVSDHYSESLVLSPSLAYPENWTLPTKRIIIHKDKNMEQYPRFAGKNNV